MKPDQEQAIQALTAELRAVLNRAVASGGIEPDDAFGALMGTASFFVGQIKDDASRSAYVETIVEIFPALVETSSRERANAPGFVQ